MVGLLSLPTDGKAAGVQLSEQLAHLAFAKILIENEIPFAAWACLPDVTKMRVTEGELDQV
jgi:hypothetical protein